MTRYVLALAAMGLAYYGLLTMLARGVLSL
jgi:hypothetical protein